MEDEDVPLLLVVGVEGRRVGEGCARKEGGEELILLAVLPVLSALDVSTIELKLVSRINYPKIIEY